MPNTRPRWVNPPDFTTPPFVGGQSPLDILNSILIPSVPTTTVPQPTSFWQGLLQSLPQAFATGMSAINPDVGRALQQQIAQRQQLEFERQQQERLSREKERMLRAQVGVDLAKQEIQEQSATRRMREAAKIEAEVRKEEREAARKNKLVDLESELLLREKFEDRSRENALQFRVKNEPLLQAMERSDMLLKNLPQQLREATELGATYRVLNQDLGLGIDMDDIDRIARIITKAEPGRLSAEDKQIVAKFDAEIARQQKEERTAKIERLKADTEYTRAGKPGSAIARDPVERATNAIISSGIANVMNDSDPAGYVQTPEGIKGRSSLNDIEQMKIMSGDPAYRVLTEEEISAHNRKRAEQIVLDAMEVKRRGKLTDEQKKKELRDDLYNKIQFSKNSGKTNEQIAAAIDKLVGTYGADLINEAKRDWLGIAPKASAMPDAKKKQPFGYIQR